ncbi:MAG: 50S ribosomal protein L4 [Patescibacteria group bacterium]|jgi:large subunit ribosomal protein L4
MKATIYNLKGEKVQEIDLNSYIFDIKPKTEVVHQVVIAQENNARKNLAHTKTKGEVRGGGKKPWKQKGTGRARAGSSRSPLWRGGGVTFGPRKERDYSVKVNKKMKNLALRMVLSDKAKENDLIVVDRLELADIKTKKFVEVLRKLPVKDAKTVVALGPQDSKLVRVAKNLPKVLAIGAGSLNIVDLLKYKYLVVSQNGLDQIEKVYGKK